MFVPVMSKKVNTYTQQIGFLQGKKNCECNQSKIYDPISILFTVWCSHKFCDKESDNNTLHKKKPNVD